MITYTHPGRPVPAARPRVVQGHTYTPEPYASYKEGLARALSLNFEKAEVPPTSVPVLRKKYFKENRYALRLKVFALNDLGDIDNFMKSVADAIVQAGLIGDDRQIQSVSAVKQVDKANPRIEFSLKPLKT